MSDTLLHAIENIVGPEHVRQNEVLAAHTTFQAGGRADFFVVPGDVETLTALVRLLKERGVPFFVLGNGSNVLVGDKGYRGAVIALGNDFAGIHVDLETGVIESGAGAGLIKVSRQAAENGLTGLEFASGIPGTVGGAIVMNAGAYGGEMKQLVLTVTLLHTKTLELSEKTGEEMGFSYRDSIVKHEPYIVLGTKLKLEKGDRGEIDAKIEELRKKRVEKQPLEYPSAGSTFKRPEGYFAAKLIEDSGLKGYTVGGAQVSEKHSGFVINRGNATFEQVIALTEQVKEKVRSQTGYELELEPIILE